MPVKKRRNAKHITVNIDIDVLKELENFCKQEKRTKSSAIELAIEEYLKNHFERKNK